MKGAFWALCSVLLVSAAQLLLRNAMQALPPVSEILAFVSALWHFSSGTGALLLGLTGYVASMGCWYLALHRMALSKAYALLSLSYILVWGAAILLPQGGMTPESVALIRGYTRGQLLEMAGRARALARPEAAEAVARACEEVCRT